MLCSAAILKASAHRRLQLRRRLQSEVALPPHLAEHRNALHCTWQNIGRTWQNILTWQNNGRVNFCSKCTQPPPSSAPPPLRCHYASHLSLVTRLLSIDIILAQAKIECTFAESTFFPHLKNITQQQMKIWKNVRLWFVNPGSLCFCLKIWQPALLWVERVCHCSQTF